MPEPVNLAFAFGLPPERALEYFRAKGYQVNPDGWAAVQAAAHAKAFTVSRVASVDILQDIRTEIDKALANGTTFAEFKRTLEPMLKAKGWWGKDEKGVQLGSPHRLANIFRTNTQVAYMNGRVRGLLENVDDRPWWKYQAVLDSRTRPAHRALSGKVFRYDDPFWKTHTPPLGWNAILPGNDVIASAIVGLKAFYSGPAVEIVGNSGARLSVTAQHPILTGRGWVDAQDLQKGDKVFTYSRDVARCAMPGDSDKNHAPTLIEKVFDALSLSGTRRCPVRSFNLNGDHKFFNGDVEIVSCNRKLMDWIEAKSREIAAYVDLLLPGNSLGSEFCDGSFSKNSIRRSRAEFAIISGDVCDALNSMFSDLGRHGVSVDSFVPQESKKAFPANLVLGRKLPTGCSRRKLIGNVIRYLALKIRTLYASQLVPDDLDPLRFGSGESRLTDVFLGGSGTNAHAASDLMEAHAGLVEIDEVVDLRLFKYSGHVYDLQTNNGIIIAGNGNGRMIAVSNCRCRISALSDTNLEREGITPESGAGRMVYRDVEVNGYQQPQTGYLDPITGEEIRTDVGWGHDRSEGWRPDPMRYAAELRPVVQSIVEDAARIEVEDANRYRPKAFTTKKSFDPEEMIDSTLSQVGDHGAWVRDAIQRQDAKALFLSLDESMPGNAESAKLSHKIKAFLGKLMSKETPEYLYMSKGFERGWTEKTWKHLIVRKQTGVGFDESMRDMVGEVIKKGYNQRKRFAFEEGMPKKYEAVSVWAHELGHILHFSVGTPPRPPFAFQFGVSKYGETNSLEWHAETFACWLFNRDEMIKTAPKIAAYFDDLVKKAAKQ